MVTKRNEYVAPATKCPHCGAPLLACNGEDGPFEVLKDAEKHEVYGSELWACGTKRLGRCGYGEEYDFDRVTETRRGNQCFADVEKKTSSDLFWAKNSLEAAKKEIAELTAEVATITAERDGAQGDWRRCRKRLIEATGVCDVCGMGASSVDSDGVITCNACGLALPAPLPLHIVKGELDA